VKLHNKALVAAPVVGLIGLLGAAPSGAQSGTAQVVVVHGIPDTTVDVYVDDKLTLDNFAFKTVTDPVTLPGGSHQLAVRAADAAPTAAPLLTASANVPAGANITVVAHLDAGGQPKITPFVNDTSKVAAGQGRLVVRHTAAAPAVDVLAGGKPTFRNLTNPNEAKADLPAGTVSASVALAGTTAPVIGPADVPVTEGSATIVYAVGSAEKKNLGVVVQSISGLHSAPASVKTGNSGLAAEGSSPVVPLAVAGAAVVLVAGAAASRRRAGAR
jgi:hypothetical protein